MTLQPLAAMTSPSRRIRSGPPLAVPSRRALPVLLLAVPSAAGGCGDAPASARWSGSVDTLASGVPVVSNPARGVWREEERWTVTEDLRIGTLEGDGPTLFGRVSDVSVDPLGRLWVAESQAAEVRVFAPDGEHVRTLGRSGGGPGEFRSPQLVLFGPRGNVWVSDLQNRRYELFDTAGRHLGSHAFQGTSFGFTARFDAEGHVVDRENIPGGDGFRSMYVRRRAEEGLPAVDTFPAPDMGEAETHELRVTVASGRTATLAMPIPFVHQPGATLEDGGFFWARRGGDEGYRFLRLGLAGDTSMVVERRFEPVPVTAAERDSVLGREGPFGAELDIPESRVPDVHPPFLSVEGLPDGHVLVDRVVAEGGVRGWDVFDPEGRYLGRLDRPAGYESFTLRELRDDALYGVVRGSFDEQYVVRLRLDRGMR